MDRFHLWALIILILLASLLAIGLLIENLSAGSGSPQLPPSIEPAGKNRKNANKNKKYPPWSNVLFAILLLSFCLRELAGLGLFMLHGEQVSGVVTEIEKSGGRRGKSFSNKVHIGEITVHYILPHGIKKGEFYTIQYTPLTLRPIGVKKLR